MWILKGKDKKGAFLPVLPEGLYNSPEALKPFMKVLG
jgi:hypothetical protein